MQLTIQISFVYTEVRPTSRGALRISRVSTIPIKSHGWQTLASHREVIVLMEHKTATDSQHASTSYARAAQSESSPQTHTSRALHPTAPHPLKTPSTTVPSGTGTQSKARVW